MSPPPRLYSWLPKNGGNRVLGYPHLCPPTPRRNLCLVGLPPAKPWNQPWNQILDESSGDLLITIAGCVAQPESDSLWQLSRG